MLKIAIGHIKALLMLIQECHWQFLRTHSMYKHVIRFMESVVKSNYSFTDVA